MIDRAARATIICARAKLAVIVTVFAAAYVVTAAQQNPFVGRWNLTGTGADNHLIYFLEVKQVGDHLITVRANVTDFGIAVDTEFVITIASPRRS